MVARQSQLFIPTLREAPADAEAVSHKLLVRGGYIRQVSTGVWTFLPLGWRVHQKVVQIIREEKDAIGGAGDAHACAHAGRAVGGDRARTRSRSSSISRIVPAAASSFRSPTRRPSPSTRARSRATGELPQLLYHFSVKDRDEPRPRGGLLRVREFIMKDAYSFDRDEAGLIRASKQEEAYHGRSPAAGWSTGRRRRSAGSWAARSRGLPRAVRLRREHARHVRER